MPLNEGNLRSTGPSFAVIRIQRVRLRVGGKVLQKPITSLPPPTHTFSDRQAVGYYVRGNRGNIGRAKTSNTCSLFRFGPEVYLNEDLRSARGRGQDSRGR